MGTRTLIGTFLLQIKSGNTEYHLKVVNESKHCSLYIISQAKTPFSRVHVVSITIQIKVAVNSSIQFHWTVDYTFVWSVSGILNPGDVVKADGDKECDPRGINHMQFTV